MPAGEGPPQSPGEDGAPGWDAIDAAIAPIVGSTSPAHFGTGTGLPDQDGLWGISAYNVDTHWFLVTYGLSELFGKVSESSEVSGWGEELTMHTAPAPEIPEWAVRLLARLGELVFQRGTPFWPGGRLEIPDAPSPMPPAVCWTEDDRLGVIDTVNGRVQFVRTVGVTDADIEAMRATSTDDVLGRMKSVDPLLVWPASGQVP